MLRNMPKWLYKHHLELGMTLTAHDLGFDGGCGRAAICLICDSDVLAAIHCTVL